MTASFSERFLPVALGATDGDVRLRLASASPDGQGVVAWAGRIEGPYCEFGRTLAAIHLLETRTLAWPGPVVGEALVTDPCYWTPAMPFLYRLEAEATLGDGAAIAVERRVGLRRFEPNRANFRLERERIVLRGVAARNVDASALSEARDAGTSLLVPNPDERLCDEADRLGVGMIADLRTLSAPAAQLVRLAWHPSVLVIFMDDSAAPSETPPGLVLGRAIRPTTTESTRGEARWAQAIAVELAPAERPPAWVADCGQPVIAIRRGAPYADLHDARAACDQLQADLAPEYNLAGYFVAT